MNKELKQNYIWNIFRGRDILLKKSESGAFLIPQSEVPPIKPETTEHVHEFESAKGLPVRAFQVSVSTVSPEGYDFVPLRTSYEYLPPDIYEIAGKMEELIYWDTRTKYCGVCGSPMKYSTNISKRCVECGNEIWPQLQTAIIVLVKRDDKILMVQSKNFRADYMGLVAGFVETGETLEQCVAREVMEETNIRIKNIRYYGSQSWPYPCGLMVGFVAEYEGGEMELQTSELNKGGWFGANNLPPVPGKVSLARRLIDAWLEHEI